MCLTFYYSLVLFIATISSDIQLPLKQGVAEGGRFYEKE